jgi:tetratricopeptide (TPR) repeat protein
MNKDSIHRISVLFVICTFAYIGLSAQEKNDAINAFNEGVILINTDPESAIIPFENCIKICEQIGDSANDVKAKAVQVLPDLYFQKAYRLFTTDKKIEESLIASKVALEVANKYSNEKTKDKTQKLMIQSYLTMGSKYFTSNENEKALSAFDSALMINPNHTKAIYNKALTYKKMNNNAKFEESIDLFLSKLDASADTAQIRQANKLALDFFSMSSAKANKANKLDDAISLLNTSTKYGIDKDVYYLYANIYNKQKKYPDAIVNAQKGLDMEVAGTPEAKAKFYYELAVAQAGKGETANACESFKNSMYGPFIEASKGQRTNLKCK